VLVTVILFWVARNLISGSASLKKLIETIDYNVNTTVDMLQRSIADVNTITERANGQMDRIEEVMENVQHLSGDARSSMHMIDETVSPILSNAHSVVAGGRKAVDTWNDIGAAEGAGGAGGGETVESDADGDE